MDIRTSIQSGITVCITRNKEGSPKTRRRKLYAYADDIVLITKKQKNNDRNTGTEWRRKKYGTQNK